MIAFIDDNRSTHGVEPICRVLPIAPSTYHERVAQRRDPSRLSARAQRDQMLKPEITRVFAENFAVYGVRKVWRQMQREGFGIARCTIERLMRDMGLAGVIRGKPVRTTISDKAAPCPQNGTCQLRAGCPGTGFARSQTCPSRRADPSQRPRFAICIHKIHRTLGRSWHRAVGRQCW